MTSPNRTVLLKAAILIIFVGVAVVLGLTVSLPSVAEIRADAALSGWWGALVFVVGYGVVTLTPVPKSVVSIAAGVAWGLFGAVLVYFGALIGAALAFVLGRALGREAIERFTGARVARVDEVLRHRGLIALIGVRLIPVLPFTVINYAAGLTSVRRRDYALGTAIGIVPGTIAYVTIGAYGTELGWPFYVSVTVLGLLTIVGVVYSMVARTRRHRREAEAEAAAEVAAA